MASPARQYPNNLPIALSSFIGRGREIVEVKRLFTTTRLLTLIGAGGCGKTRLAMWVAAELGEAFADGVWLVELASLSNPDLAPQTVATALSVCEQTGRSVFDSLNDHLLTRELLLVLDNCEHLVAACARLAHNLLQSCPGLRILATSREPLNISGETVWTVPPLSIPELALAGQAATSAVDQLQYEAVRLFIERASAVSPAFTLTDQNATAVAEICQRLDGIPLAIELAAARVRALSVQQIAERLDDRFHLLTGGSRTAPPRHQTLEATLDWSYALLPEKERQVLQRLSVFAGGWSLEAAEEVCASEGLKTGDVFDVLSRLVDKSLVLVDQSDGSGRYRLLETIRQYARTKLTESGQVDRARDPHLDHFLRWAEKTEPQLDGPGQLIWLKRFEAEHDNVRAALEWSLSAGAVEKGLRLAAAAGRFWRLCGYLSEGRARLSLALSQVGAQKPQYAATRARALSRAALMAYLQSDYPTTRSLCEASLAIWRELGPAGRSGVAAALSMLGEVATEEGDYATASALFEEALTIWREVKDTRGFSDTLLQLGWAAMRTGDYEQAAIRMEESLTLFREGGHTAYVALNLSGLGEMAVRQGSTSVRHGCSKRVCRCDGKFETSGASAHHSAR